MTDAPPSSLDSAIKDVRRLESAGDFLIAHERAMAVLAVWPNDLTLRYRAVLTLARAGTIDDALALYEKYELGAVESMDERSLKGRILKDRALTLDGEARRAKLREAAACYAAAYAFGNGYFPAINAATLYFLAGDRDQSATWRQRTVTACDADRSTTLIESYWRSATLAEAALLAGDEAATARALAEATAMPRDVAAWAATRRQLAAICAAQGRDEGILAPLRLPAAIHYAGHMMEPLGVARRLPAEREGEIAAAIRARLEQHDAGFLCGSLACGADILFAEAALDRKAELHVVLPFAEDDFIRLSVARGGLGWEARFRDCLARATSATWATDARHDGDDALFTYASRIAMGQATLMAQRIGGPLHQIAVWDGQPPSSIAGTAVDVAAWKALGRETDEIQLPAQPAALSASPLPPPQGASPRTIRAILYGDVHGFSGLHDDQVPLFERHFLGAIAEAVAPHAATLCYRDTWGDAIFLAFDDVGVAAQAALAVQQRLRPFKEGTLGLPIDLQLRLAGHLGPTYDGFDPLRGAKSVIGAHITRAERLEKVTPTGAVYVTEPFAAALALNPAAGVSVTYVGHKPTSKGYSSLRLYRLDRVAESQA